MRSQVDHDDRYAVQLCECCGGSGRTVSLTTVRRFAGDTTLRTFKHLVPCAGCAGTGEAGDPVLTARVQSRQLLNSAALVRVLDKVSR
jgi:hypothetical protein